MSRQFTFWSKKRGTRRTGSQLLGGIGEALFYAMLLLFGTISLAVVVTAQAIHVSAGGSAMSAWTLTLYVLIAVLCAGIGGGGMFYATARVGASAERRSAIAKKAANIDLLKDRPATAKKYPTIPRVTNVENSPGVQLAYRLPIIQSPTWRFFSISLFWLASAGFATVLMVWAMAGQSLLPPDTPRFYVTSPFLMIAIAATYFFVRALAIQISLGPTTVEISDHPLHPGQCYQVFLSQAGHLTIKWLTLRLVCEEEATYQEGTNIRTETRPVCSQKVFRKADFRIKPGIPFESEFELRIPAEAMHSFKSPNNSVNWKLVVRGEAAGWPVFERSFPVIVFPCSNN